MGRYSKLYSNYVLKKRHQAVEGGTIFERDWGTLGERHVIESGKKRVYGDSTFFSQTTTDQETAIVTAAANGARLLLRTHLTKK